MNLEAAYDAITNEIIAKWPAASESVTGFPVTLKFAGVEDVDANGKIIVPETSFIRVTMLPVIEPQSTFRNGELGQRYNHQGNIIVQVFSDRQDGRYEEIARKLAEEVLLLFRGVTMGDCIIFRNVRREKLNDERHFARWNVVAEYDFDEIV